MFFQPIHILRALNTGTCLWLDDLFYCAGLHRNLVLTTANRGKIGRGLRKNAGELTGMVEISKEEILGSKGSMHVHTLTHSRPQRENV